MFIFFIYFLYCEVIIGIASESLNDWADEQAGIEAVQRILDSLDDIHAMQDPYVDNEVYHGMLTDRRLASLLKVCFAKIKHNI